MKSSLWTLPQNLSNRPASIVYAAAAIALVFGSPATYAQPVVSGPTQVSNTPPAAVQPDSSESAPRISASSLFQWGFVTAHPHLSYRYLYGDGLQSSPGVQKKTSISTVTPGVLFNIGTHWTLDYSPTQTYYSDSSFTDTLDHSVRILGSTNYEDWSFRLSQSFATSDTPLIETGRQTKEDSYATMATLGYHFSNKVQLDTNLNYTARFTTVFPDSRETTIGERLHYQFLPRTDASVSVDYGDINMSEGTDMTFTRPGIAFNWKATEKASFNVNAGFESRKFRTGGADSLNSPTFGAAFQFQPLTTTTINLSATRGVAVAYFSNQITRNTGWTLNVQQRLLQHFFLSAGYSGQKSTYLSTDPLVVAGRGDKSHSVNVRLSTVFFERASVALLYQNTHNDSNASGFGFSSSQIGVELSYQF